jgi:large subunit ribosomal protein L31
MVIDEGQLNKFKRRFADLEELSTVATANSPSGEWSMAKPEPKTASSGKGKGKKK